MTRYSEDSHFQQSEADKVAILEFELRRATQTINSLRSELTQQVCVDIHCVSNIIVVPRIQLKVFYFAQDFAVRSIALPAIFYLRSVSLIQKNDEASSEN